jgi:hypothetical protein
MGREVVLWWVIGVLGRVRELVWWVTYMGDGNCEAEES